MGKGAKAERVELLPPSHTWISWGILLSYTVVFVEGIVLNLLHFGANDETALHRIGHAQFHLCTIYALEAAMAVGPGWCAMSPGWTCSELLMHHVPYAVATALAFWGGHATRWTAPMLVVLLTPLNEGLFIVSGLGAPEWVNKFRRAFGFCIVSTLLAVESWTLMRCWKMAWDGKSALSDLMADNIVWGGIYYHSLLVKLYLRRWARTGSLIS